MVSVSHPPPYPRRHPPPPLADSPGTVLISPPTTADERGRWAVVGGGLAGAGAGAEVRVGVSSLTCLADSLDLASRRQLDVGPYSIPPRQMTSCKPSSKNGQPNALGPRSDQVSARRAWVSKINQLHNPLPTTYPSCCSRPLPTARRPPPVHRPPSTARRPPPVRQTAQQHQTFGGSAGRPPRNLASIAEQTLPERPTRLTGLTTARLGGQAGRRASSERREGYLASGQSGGRQAERGRRVERAGG